MTDLFYEALVSHDGRMSLGMAKSTVGSFRSLLKGMDTSQYMVPARKLYDTTAIHILRPEFYERDLYVVNFHSQHYRLVSPSYVHVQLRLDVDSSLDAQESTG